MTEQIIVYIYGVLVAVGGVIGYLKAKSLPSLIMGLLFGIGLLGASYALQKNYNAAFCAILGLSGFLTLFFGYRYWLTKGFMPGGLMAILSLVVFLLISLMRTKGVH